MSEWCGCYKSCWSYLACISYPPMYILLVYPISKSYESNVRAHFWVLVWDFRFCCINFNTLFGIENWKWKSVVCLQNKVSSKNHFLKANTKSRPSFSIWQLWHFRREICEKHTLQGSFSLSKAADIFLTNSSSH